MRFINDVSSKNQPTAGKPAAGSHSPIPSSSFNVQHNSNRDSPSDGFINDFSSRSSAEARKLQHMLDLEAKLAAEDEANTAAKKAEDEAREFKLLRDLKVMNEMQIEDLTKQLKKVTGDMADVKSNNTDLKGKLDCEKEESHKARQEAGRYSSAVGELRKEVNTNNNAIGELRRQLDSNNNLDPACHGREARIVHLRSNTAVDFGAGKSSLHAADTTALFSFMHS